LHKARKKQSPAPPALPPGWDVQLRERSFGSLQAIKDPVLLGTVVEEMIEQLGKGSEIETERLTGIERSTLNRLRAKHPRRKGKSTKHNRILHMTAWRLEQAAKRLGPGWHRKFLRSMGADRRRMSGYREWVAERVTRWERRRGAHWRCVDGRVEVAGRGTRFKVSRQRFLEHTSQEIQGVLKERRPATFKKILDFEEVGFNKAGIERARLAWVRIIEPLLEWPESALVEVPWWALELDKLCQFIEAGLARERLLIEARGTDTDRVEMPCVGGPAPKVS
jgi:hypothetical protein